MDVLVLSQGYQPLRRVSWEHAISLLFTGRCEVIAEYADRIVRSAQQTFKVPSVIRFLRRVTSKMFRRKVKFSRKNVWLRDKGQCQYCGGKVPMTDFTYDHVNPQSRGGKTTWENIVVACIPCNQKKGCMTPLEARMKLRAKPVRPKTLPGNPDGMLRWNTRMPESWKDYMGTMAYWCDSLS